MRRFGAVILLTFLLASRAHAEIVSVPPDTSRWDYAGDVKPDVYQGRPCLLVNGGLAFPRDVKMRDGVIDVDVAASKGRGFIGLEFRASDDIAQAEWIYLRPHESGQADAIQYTPVLNTGANWQIYNGDGFTAAVDIPLETWFHVRIVVAGAQAKLFVSDMDKPALVIGDLKGELKEGRVGIRVLTGKTYFSNFQVTKTPDAPWERHLPAMPPGTLTQWKISPSYDALARDLERPLVRAERDTMRWQDVIAEPPGFVVLYRYRTAPHLRVSFENDFSKRLEPQPGMLVLYARTTIHSRRDQVKKLLIGYSDDVSVFLNDRILYRGRSAQYFRDPRFLGIVNPENDEVFLPLKKGDNELTLAVSEIGGGWGFICRLADAKP